MNYLGRVSRYTRNQFDFGGGADDVMAVSGPKGKTGLLWDYGVYDVTEVFNGGTSMPKLSVGTIDDPDLYGEDFDMGAVAENGGSKSIRTTYAPGSADWDLYMLERHLPADTPVALKMIAATGSGLTGIATAFMDIIWAD